METFDFSRPIFKPCNKCEFFDGEVTCIINNRNLYCNFLKDEHCDDFILKGLYSKDDIQCILKEKILRGNICKRNLK